MTFDPAKTAVVLIEYQNDFTSEGGVLHGAVQPVMEKTDMLANTERVVEAARSAGATIMHAPIMFTKGYNEISAHPYGILKGVVDGNAFVKGTWGAATSVEEHENGIKYDYPMFSKPMTSSELIAELT